MHPVSIGVAVLIAAYALARWRHIGNGRRAAAAILAAGFAVYGSGVVQIPSLAQLVHTVGHALGPYTYLVVGAAAFLETGAFVGLIVPGETAIIAGGVIAGHGQVSLGLLIAVVIVCALGGDVTSYLLGRRLGRDFLLRHGEKVKITRPRLERVEGFFSDHGRSAVFLGRFVGLVRAVLPFVAGASRFALPTYVAIDVLGCAIWGTAYVVLGYVFSSNLQRASSLAGTGGFAIAAAIVVVVGGIAAYRVLRIPDNRVKLRRYLDERADRPVVGPAIRGTRRIGRPVAGAARRLGLREVAGSLSALVGVGVVAAAGFGVLAGALAAQRFVVGDRPALRLVGRLYDPTGAQAATAVTDLGSTPALAALVVVVALALAARRCLAPATVLVAGALLGILGDQLAKVAEGRARPPHRLVPAEGYSFPSGHATHAVAWAVVAIVLARELRGSPARVALVGLGVAVALAIGLSRVYLRVHYLSDVLGGWGLGTAIFCACALVALLVGRLRHNARRP